MKFKCKYLKPDELIKTGTLYQIPKSRKITIDEDKTKDRVVISYIVQDAQYGIESYISKKQGEYFVCNLQVQCG